MLIANPKATSTSRQVRDLLVRTFSGDLDLELVETEHRNHATELGISQMHVSRLLARTLTQLREGLTVED